MNKIFKTKYDVTTGQTKVVSELANNRQVASRIEGSSVAEKCGDFLGNFLGAFKVLPLALVMSGLLSSAAYGAYLYVDTDWTPEDKDKNQKNSSYKLETNNTNILNRSSKIWFKDNTENDDVQNDAVILSSKHNKTGNKTTYKNKDFDKIVVVGSRAVAGGHGATVMGYQAVAGQHTETGQISDHYAKSKLHDPKYQDFKTRYDNPPGLIKLVKETQQKQVLNEFKKQLLKEEKESLNREGTAIGYKSFARGNEATAMGNDVVAWGDSSIAIGSDNAAGDESVLNRDIFRLYYNARADFNDTSSYAATDFVKQHEDSRLPVYADSDSILFGEDGQHISTSNGRIYIRKETVKNGKKTPDYSNGYYIYDPSFNENFHEYDERGNAVKTIAHNNGEATRIKQLSDWKRYEAHKKEIDDKYEEYLKKPDSKKHKSHTWARGANAIVIGARSIGFGKNSTALGTFALAARDYSTAIGSNTLAFGEKSLAVGNQSYVYSNDSIGVGNTVQAINTGSMVFGANSFAGGRGSLALGDHTFANIKMDEKFNDKGITKTGFGLGDATAALHEDQLDIEKLYEKGHTQEIQDLGKKYFLAKTTKQKGTGELKAEQSRDKNGLPNQGAVAIGSYSVALGDNAISLGRFSYTKGDNSLALGRFAFAQKDSSFSIGNFSRALGEKSVAFGTQTLVEADESMALGIGTKVLGEMPVELMNAENKKQKNRKNSKFKIPVKNAMAIGNGAEASFSDSIALGVNSVTDYTETEMAKDGWAPKYAISLPSSEKIGYLSVGGKNAERRIVNVAPGASDTDAVNVSQLRSLEEAILYGNTLAEDDDNTNPGTHYVSVKGRSEYSKLVTKEQDYKNYTKIKKDYLKLKARRDANQETISLTNLENKLAQYEKKYEDFKGSASKLEGENTKSYVLLETENMKKDPELAKKIRKQHLDRIYADIDTAYNQDNESAVTDRLIPEDKKAELKLSNFKNDGAKGSGSMAIGVGALTNSPESIVIGRNARLDVNNANNTVLLGNNTSSATANAVALGNYAVADRTPEPASKLDAPGRSNAYISEDLANLIDEHHAYAAVSVGRYGGDLNDLKNNVATEEAYKQWEKDNASLKSSNSSEYEQKRLAETAKIKKFALRKITNVAPGTKDTDVVILAQLKEAMKGVGPATHYVSVKGTDQSDDSNYKNDGAKGTDSVAIGVSAATDKSATAGIAIGKGAKSEAENAVAIGNGASIDVPNSFVMGSNNIVNQSNKETRGAVVVIGSGIKLDESKSSIAIGAVYLEGRDGAKDGTVIENAAWTASIGNKNKIKNGTDIIAVGNNIKIQGDLTAEEESKYAERIRQRPRQKTKIESEKTDTIKNFNTEVVAIGNGADAIRAKNSVLIGAKTKAESNATQAVIIGYEATAKENAVGAVVIGQGASVETLAGDSIALGQGSKATKKETAPSKATSSKNVNFTWTAGVGNNKSVVSLGDTSKERQIKHVAAGAVTKTSTDAINGSQLYAVADEFSKLAVDVLGAEADTTSGFKKSLFNQLIGANGSPAAATPATEKTFKKAIDDNIAKINEGFKFGDGSTDGTHYLGSTLNIKAGNIDSGAFTSDNIKTHYEENDKNILIGIKKDPSFEKVTVTKDMTNESNGLVLATKNYVDTKFNSAGSTLKFTADNGNTQTLAKNGTLQVKGTSGEITTTASNNDTVTIALDQTLKGKINTAATTAATAAQKAEAATTKADANAQAIAQKEDKLTKGNITATDGLVEVTGGTDAVIGSGVTIGLNEATKTKLNSIGTGAIGGTSTSNSDKTVTGQTVYDYLQDFSKTLTLSTNGTADSGSVNLKNGKLHVTGSDGVGVDISGSKITVKLDDTTKDKINNALSGTAADGKYAKIDGSNITESAWRTKLDVYTKSETNSAVEKAKETVTNGTGIKVESLDSTTGGKQFTVSLDSDTQTKLGNIGTGEVSATENNKTVTGAKVHTAIEEAKKALNTQISGKVDTDTFNTEIAKKANMTLDNIDGKGQKVIKSLISAEGQNGIEVTTSHGDSEDSNAKTFSIKLDATTKSKIDSIGTGRVAANNTNTVTGGAVHNAIEAAKTGLYSNNATFGLTDDSGNQVTKKLNENISVKGSSTAKSGGTNISVSLDTKENPIGLKVELGETLSGIKKISNGNTEITLDDKEGVQIKHSDGTSSKLVNEGGFNNLSGGDEIKVTGGGKVFGDATSLSLNANSIDGSKLKNNTITETQLASSVTGKLNKEFKVKTGNDTSSNLIGETLEFKGDSYITPKLDSGNKSITYTLNVAESLDDTQSSTGGTQNGAQAQDGAAGTQGNTLSKKLVSADAVKNYVNSKISSYSSTLGLEADNTSSDTNNPKGKVDLKTTSLKITGDGNISTSVVSDKNTVSIKLTEALKNITSIASKEEYETDTPSTKAAKSIITLGNDLTLANTGKSFTIKSDHILSDNEIYVGTKEDSNKLVKQSELTSKISSIQNNLTTIGTGTISDSDSDNNTVTGKTVKTYVDGKTFKLAGNDSDAVSSQLDGTINIKGDISTTSDKGNVYVSKVTDSTQDANPKEYLQIQLGKNLTGIESIQKGDNKAKLTLGDKTASLENAKDKSKIELKDDGILLTTNKDKTITVKDNALSGVNKITAVSRGTDNTNENSIDLAGGTNKNDVVINVGGKALTLTTSGTDNTAKVKISGIANGTGDDDAINKSQLASVVAALGGSAAIDADGTIKAPTYTLTNGGAKSTVGEALTALDGAITATKSSMGTLESASITFSDGTHNFTRANNESNKKVVIKSGDNVTVSLDNTKDSNKTGEFTVALKDALTGIKTIELKDDKGSHSKTIAVNNQGDFIVREEITENGQKKNIENEIITSGNIGNQTITYKANGVNAKTVKLTDGLNFVKDDHSNINVEVKDNGEIKHTLANNLKEIDSIQSGKDAKGAKISFTSDTDTTADPANNNVKNKIEFTIGTQSTSTQGQDSATVTSTTFSFSEKGLDLGSKQIKNVASGITSDGGTTSKVLTGGESIKEISSNVVNVKDLSDVAKAIIDKGLTFKGTELKDDKTQQQATISLGSTIEIDSSESKNGKASKDIKVSVSANKITLALNKSEALSLEDERVVTSKVVKTALDDMKNEINNKISKTDANNPFETTYKDKDGNELVKVGDKYFKKEDVENLKYDEANKKFVNKDGSDLNSENQPKEVVKNEVKEEINLKGDTPKKIANVDSGLGLEKYQEPDTNGMDDEAKKDKLAEAEKNHQKAKKDAIDKLLGNKADKANKANNIKDSDPMLNNVATIRDLQALGQAGLDFAGNDTATSVHRNLGQKLVIKGDKTETNQTAPAESQAGATASTAPKSFESAKDNINVAVESEALVVQLSKNLKNLTSAEFTSEETNSDGAKQKFKTTINGKGTTIVELGDDGNVKENGKKAEYTLDGTKVTDGKNTFVTTAIETKLTTEKGDTTSITGNAITLKGKDGKPTLATLNKDGLTVGDSTNADDKTHAVYGKDGFTVKGKDGKDGKDAISLKVTKDKDGKETATLAFGKGADDKYIGAITGLADLDDGADGSSVVNKNFVKNEVEKLDQKLSSANSNRPFDYYLDNEKVVKGQDGQFYKPTDLESATYARGKYTKDGNDVVSSIKDKQSEVVIKAEPKAMVVSNIADGKLSTDSKDAINGGQLVKATGAKWIDNPNSSETAPKPKIMVFADGKDGLSGLEKTSDGKESMAAKGLTGKDGLNGKNANDKANALRDGEAGTVVFTDKDGNRLVKTNDGKYYKATDVNADGSVKKTDGQDAPQPVDTPQLSLVNHEGEATKPVVLGNVASGLGISAITDRDKQLLTKAVEEKEEELKTTHKALQTAKDEVGEKQQALEAANNVLSQMAIERPALLMKQAEIEQQLKGLSATDPQRATAQAMLNEVKEALTKNDQNMTKATKTVSEASAALDQAKITLADNVLKAYAAQQALATAEETLRNKENGVDRVQALLSDNSDIAKEKANNVVTVKDLKVVAKAGLNFEGNDGKRVHKDLSETLAIKGEENASGDKFNSNHTASGNIKVEMAQDGKGLEVKLSDQLKNMTSFETREVDGKKSRLDSNGLQASSPDSETFVNAQGTRITGKGNHAAQSASYTLDGMAITGKNGSVQLNTTALSFATTRDQAGKPVGTGVIRGLKDLDAHATGDMATNKNYVDEKVGAAVNRLDNVISTNNRTLQAGIAGANAAAALPTVTMPGKSTIALSAGTYKGRNAVAIGYSRLSDNGKITLKLQGNSNSAGDFGGGVGVGWTW
ncbi:YadA-like family protein [Histophilus somni]|uniref:YadA-like family protein n=2 Tax=Histophilus somni TaxID=731 RepID=UPI00201EFC30|nr:YadA-like family protein [Histophilus somni]